MALTYNWKIRSLKKVNTDNLSNAIVNVQWLCTGSDSDGVSGSFTGQTDFNLSVIDQTNFTPYENLTEEMVLGWVKPLVVNSYWNQVNSEINKEINNKKNPIVQVSDQSLPWNVSANT